jgi:pyruvate,water dikinase
MSLFSKPKRSDEAAIPDLDRRIAWFREILHANNAALGFIAELQESMESPHHITKAGASRIVAGVMVQAFRMISNLMRIAGNRKYKELIALFNDLKTRVSRTVELIPALKPVGFVLPLVEVGPELAEAVGRKSAYLGEARRILHAHVPDGFAITAEAYRAFMAHDELGARIAPIVRGFRDGDMGSRFEASARLVQMVENAEVPSELSKAIEEAVRGLRGGPGLRVAVRSSALQEGGHEMSFAGQYRSILNVRREGVVDAFRRVVASKYSPQAITYWTERGFTDAEVAMCCCVVTMVDAAAAGVLYTSFPHSSRTRTIIQAVRGLGLTAGAGSVEPDTFTLDPGSHKVIDVRSGLQKILLRSAAGEGTEEVTLSEADRRTPAITQEQALSISELAWKTETALKMPLDVEWAIDLRGRAFILQVRPLFDLSSRFGAARRPVLEGAPILLHRGTRASGGAGAGPVCVVDTDLDMINCPPGSVVTVREANPRLTVLLPRAAAIVADMGEVTGHLATVARELRVPALFATRRATEVLKSGDLVTVDADAEIVYAGRIDSVLPDKEPRTVPHDAVREMLQAVAPLIIPLTLRDRFASGYSPRTCKTIHDVIRFCHQATIEAMFDLGDKALRHSRSVRRLVSPVPIDCRILDLGGGLNPRKDGDSVEISEVACRPMRALWKGMTDPRLHWRQTRPVSLKGFMSAVVDYNFDLDARLRPMGEPSYVFVTADYMNLNSRIGYHFSTVDARVCDTIELNYASFRFVGGSTGIEQRSRRALLIERLLAARGFETDCRADLVNARIRHRPAEVMDRALLEVGLLMGYVNHLDMALVSEEVTRQYEDAFLAGNYEFKA